METGASGRLSINRHRSEQCPDMDTQGWELSGLIRDGMSRSGLIIKLIKLLPPEDVFVSNV